MEKEKVLEILKTGELELVGQFSWGSNSTFLVKARTEDTEIEAVYKPVSGEQPLWDFPEETLAKREVAAFLVSGQLGWDLVPPTAFREDGPYGPGSLQLRVEHDPEQNYFTFNEETRERLRPVAVFDLLVNNADRKGGHILLGESGKIWLIDHGICFHEESKLRTVIWDFVGEEIPADLIGDVENLRERLAAGGELVGDLAKLLSEGEIRALRERVETLLEQGVFPKMPQDQRAVPWPLV